MAQSWQLPTSSSRGGGFQNFLLYPADSWNWAGYILPPRDDGVRWVLRDDNISVVATEYQLEEQSFSISFLFRESNDPSEYVVVVMGFQDGSRTPTIGQNTDVLGYARIRALTDAR